MVSCSCGFALGGPPAASLTRCPFCRRALPVGQAALAAPSKRSPWAALISAPRGRKINWEIAFGFVGHLLAGLLFAFHSPLSATLGPALLLSCGGLLLWGLGCCAQAKGYSPLLGLVGVFSLVGLLILICLPDKFKRLA